MNNNVVIIVCAVMVLASAGVAFLALSNKQKLAKTLEEERYSRMVAEESSQKSAAKMISLSNQLKSAEDKMAKIQDILEQEKGINADLKSQYERLTQTKSDLETKLRTAESEARQVLSEVPAVVQPQAASIETTPAIDQSATQGAAMASAGVQ